MFRFLEKVYTRDIDSVELRICFSFVFMGARIHSRARDGTHSLDSLGFGTFCVKHVGLIGDMA